ncbi:MAG TPA: glycosyltransferase [Polyangiaceae bacterium]|nr:glycosyltransferase [Polyangiaceae bacterium]
MFPSLIVVPCYNEERRFHADAFVSFARQHANVSFLFVDDGSTDATQRVLAGTCCALPEQLSLLALPKNVGKAEAVRRGMTQALATPVAVVGYVDADLATPLGELEPMRAHFETSKAELVFGARVALLGRDIRRSLVRHYLGRSFATAASTILRLPVYDTQCGAKLFRNTALAREVFGERFDSNWAFDVEVIARYSQGLARDGVPIQTAAIEHPLQRWHDISGSKLKPQAALGAAGELWRIYRRYYGRGCR